MGRVSRSRRVCSPLGECGFFHTQTLVQRDVDFSLFGSKTLYVRPPKNLCGPTSLGKTPCEMMRRDLYGRCSLVCVTDLATLTSFSTHLDSYRHPHHSHVALDYAQFLLHIPCIYELFTSDCYFASPDESLLWTAVAAVY